MMFLTSLRPTLTYCGVCLFFLVILFVQNISASTISGTVYDPQRNPLPDIDVELLDDLYRQIGRARTDGTGRYHFNGLSDGNYTVKVLAFRFDFMDESQYVEIRTISIRGSGTGNAYETRDFYLKPKRGSLADTELGVIFAQEVPKEAEKTFEQAVKDLSKRKTDEAVVGLKKALNLFPDYYLALQQLGIILIKKGEFSEAAPLLLKAAEINPKSPTTLFYLGYSLHKLSYHKAAVTALSQAHNLAPASVEVLLTLGTAERMDGKYEDAEKHLLRAKKLTKESIPEIHWELAQLYGLNMKRYKEASSELEQYLKSGKYDAEHIKKIKKLISEFEEKAKTQSNKS